MTSTTCHDAPPICVQSATDDACAAPARAPAECNDASHEWLCPAGARVYARATDAPSVCLPFHDASTIVRGDRVRLRLRANGLEHVFGIGFGTTLETHTASDVAGPWTKGASLGACAVPSADPSSLCAGPVVHEELADPTRPSELPITYGVGSTGTRTSDPDDYWTRLVWTH